MNNDRWFSVFVAFFGGGCFFQALMIAPFLASIPPGTWPPPEQVAEAGSAQYFLAIILSIYLAFSITAFVSAVGIYLRKNWGPWLWLATCATLLLTISVGILTFGLSWSAYIAELLIAFYSLFFYRNRFALWRENAL